MNKVDNELNSQFQELSLYTLSHHDINYFIHQHIVDAFQAQTTDNNTKPVTLIFSLIGLYLYIEKNYSGKQVQQAHLLLAKKKKNLRIKVELPERKGNITISNVLNTGIGIKRDKMIKKWCTSVWDSYSKCHEIIDAVVNKELSLED